MSMRKLEDLLNFLQSNRPPDRRIHVLLFLPVLLFAQALSAQDIKISLLTCTPGDELYSTYGHSALLVERPSGKTVYNYGTFDFNTPNFALKFIKGDLLYYLNPERIEDFIWEYEHQGRGVVRQELDLTAEQKKRILDFLAENMRPENRAYLYDFFFDNCSTRIRDLLEKVLDIQYPEGAKDNRTYRELLRPYLEDTPWYLFGTNLILGSPTDRPAGFRGAMFLPDYLSENLAQAKVDGHLLLKPAEVLVPRTSFSKKAAFDAPLWAAIGMLLLSVLVSFAARPLRSVFDVVVFGAAGLSGVLFLFMWLGTRHEVCYYNYNMLWGNVLFLFLPFFAGRVRTWRIVVVYLLFVLAAWFVVPQRLPVAMFIFTIGLLIRAAHRSGYLKIGNCLGTHKFLS